MSFYKSPPPPYYESVLDDYSSYPSVFDSFKQSLASFTMSPSKIELDVIPVGPVDMYGEPDKESSYSLSGQVEVTLVPPSGWLFDAPPTDESFILDSLVLTFRGQSEIVAPQTGHASCRLITFSEELLTNGPISLRHTWDEGSREPARWFVVFDLKVPGWLPPTTNTTFGDLLHEEPETNYSLSAFARYRETKPISSWRSTCSGQSGFTTTKRSAHMPGRDIQINRYKLPPPQCMLGHTEFPDSPFRSAEYSGSIMDGSSRIPIDILSKLRMRACVPEHIAMDAGSFPLLLKIRPDGLSADVRKRLHLNGFFVSADQKELYRSSFSTQYAARWPIPPASEQPPMRRLSSCRDDVNGYRCGMECTPAPGTTAQVTHSLLPPGFSGRVELDGANDSKASFSDERLDNEDTWVRIRIDIPFRELLIDACHLPEYKHSAVPKLRPTGLGPILTVSHSLEIALTCTYDVPETDAGSSSLPGPDRLLDELKLTIPLSFVQVPRSGMHQPVVDSFTADCDGPLSRTGPAGSVRLETQRVQPSQPYAQSLPAYNQLYYKNGARREDPTPLPLYTPAGQGPEEAPVPRPGPMVCKQTPIHKAILDPPPEPRY